MTTAVEFQDPPVVEVALSVQFEPLARLTGAHTGLYWHGIKDRFPTVEQHPRLDPIVERFDRPDFAPRMIRIDLGDAAPRFWFMTPNQTELIQIQSDRFVHNWRKKGVDPYPHYDTSEGKTPPLRETFLEGLRGFEAFLLRERIGTVVANQCEVTYINHIDPIPSSNPHARIRDVLTLWSGDVNPGAPSSLESADLRVRYLIDYRGETVGRLHVELQPAFTQDGAKPIWVLILTARGRPIGEGLGGVMNFLDLGRQFMLDVFVGITRPELQKKWGSKE